MRLTRFRAALFFLVVGLLVLILGESSALATSAPPSAMASAITVDVKAGFDGYYKEYGWLPIQVTLNLPAGQPAFQGRVEASFSNFAANSPRYLRSVQLSPPARKTIWLYMSGPRSLRQVQVRLVADDNSLVLPIVQKDVSPLGDSSLLLGVVSDDTSALNYLNGTELGREPLAYSPFLFGYNYSSQTAAPLLSSTPRASIAHLTLADLPPMGNTWNSLDGLVIADLNVSQFSGDLNTLKNALSGWLVEGGALIVAGDSGLRNAPFTQSFVPVQNVASAPRSVSTQALNNALQSYTQVKNALPSGTITLADAQIAPGSQVLLDFQGKPLLASRPFGLGQSWFFASELKPLRSWDGIVPFWKTLLKDYRPRNNYTTAAHRANEGPYQEWSVRLTPSPQTPELPKPWGLAAFLAFYVLLVGPVNYFILSRLDKRELAWLTVPALTIIFSLGTYMVSNLSQRSDMVMSRLAIVTLGEGNDGKLTGTTSGLVGFYSNGRNDFDLKVAEEALSFSVFDGERSTYYYGGGNPNIPQILLNQQGPGGGLGRISMGIRAQRSFAYEKDGAISEGIQARLKLVNNGLEGTLENLSKQDWEDIVLIVPGTNGSVQKIGLVKAGEKREVKIDSKVGYQTNLVQTITGKSNYYQNPGSSTRSYNSTPYYFNSSSPPNSLPAQKALVLETLFGPNGDGLPADKNRYYLTAWREQTQVPLTAENRPMENYDLTLLFQPLTATS